jgi:exonuclease VII large subunit
MGVDRMKQIHHGQNVKEVVGFAQSLRDYSPCEKAIKVINKELDKWKKIEATTSSNKKLDESQEMIKQLEKEIKRLSRRTIDAYRKEYQDLSWRFGSCHFKMTLHKRYKHHGIHIRLVYQDGGFDSLSLVVRRDARKIYRALICPAI